MADAPNVSGAPAKAAGALKRVPKWAWIAGAGVTGGVIFYRFTHKSAPDTADTADATSPADYGQTYSPLGTVTATPVSSGGDYSTPAAGGFSASDVADFLNTAQQGWQAQQQNQPPPIGAVDLLNAVLPYVGGGAPQSTATAAPPAPAPAAPRAPAPAAKPVDKCTGSFPFDAGNGDCYRVQCNPPGHAKGRYHFHKSGACAGGCRVATTC